MTLEEEARLSYYRKVTELDAQRHMELVKHVETQRLCIRKELSVYSLGVYQFLQNHHIAHTPEILELVEDDGRLIVIEEYLSGVNLQDILNREGCLPYERALDITIRLCRILRDFHACQPPIINRDIKPSNLVISSSGEVQLVDLNAAKWLNTEEKRDTELIGTQGYAAPEQYGFAPSDIRTDIYAVGVLLNRLLTGKLPREEVPDGPVGAVILRCTQIDPAMRYSNTDELMTALEVLMQEYRIHHGGRSDEQPQNMTEWMNRPKRTGEKTSFGRSTFESSKDPAGPPAYCMSYLPPGIRSDKWIIRIISAAVYIFLIVVCLDMQIQKEGQGYLTGWPLWVYRIAALLIILLETAFWGNYRGIQHRIGLYRLSPAVRWIIRILIGIGILFGMLLLIMIFS